MGMNISSKQMDITESIRHYIEDKYKKLDKWHTQLINPHFMLHKEASEFIAEASIGLKGSQLVASAKNHDMYTAINELITKLEKQLNKSQHKAESRRSIDKEKLSSLNDE